MAALEHIQALADELARYDCLGDPVPAGIDVPDDYEAGLHEAARRLHAALALPAAPTEEPTP